MGECGKTIPLKEESPMSSEAIHLGSLGAGVQSSTFAAMADAGEIQPRPLAFGFSDTEAEPKRVYDWLNYLESRLTIPIIRLSRGNLTKNTLATKINKKTGNPYYSNLIPAFTLSPSGSAGQVSRHCTHDHKIVPLLKWARETATNTRIKAWQKKWSA